MTDAATALDALGDPTRRAILELLADGERHVAAIASQVPVSRPAVSRHLRVLADAGLVDGRTEGTRRLYRLDPDGHAAVEEYLRATWRLAASRFALLAGNTAEVDGEGPVRVDDLVDDVDDDELGRS